MFGYRRMSIRVADYTVLSVLETCAYLDRLSFEIERALTSGGNCKVYSWSNNLHMKLETKTYCIHRHLEQRTGKDSINVICEDGLEKWGTRVRAEGRRESNSIKVRKDQNLISFKCILCGSVPPE